MDKINQLTSIIPTNNLGGKFLYAFGLYEGTYQPVPTSSSDTPTSITLTLNPQSLEIDEPFATEFQPTIGGMVIETRGQLWKDCAISGTTGFNPAQRAALEPVGSGYTDFLRLRNMFRYYAMIKRGEVPLYMTPDARASVYMVFANYKDNEFWIVEPQTFQMPPRRNMLYSYNIRFRMVGPADERPGIFNQQLASTQLDSILRVKTLADLVPIVARLKEYYAKALEFEEFVLATAQQVVNIAMEAVYFVIESLDTATKLVEKPINFVRQNVLDAINGIAQVEVAFADMWWGIPLDLQYTWQQIKLDMYRIYTADGLFNTDPNDDRNALYETRSAESRPHETRITGSAYRADSVAAGESIFDAARRLMGSSSRFMELISFNNLKPPYFSKTPGDRQPGVLAPGDTILIPTQGQSAGTYSKVSVEDDVTRPETTGTANKEITDGKDWVFHTDVTWLPHTWRGYHATITDAFGVEYNTIVTDNDEHTVRIPHQANAVFPVQWKIVDMSVEAVRDFKLSPSFAYGVDLALADDDLILGSHGDLGMTTGTPNFNQALDTKMRSEQGSLPMHSWFGFLRGTGTKGTPQSMLNTRLSVNATLKADSRVEDVRDVVVDLSGDTLYIRATIALKNSNMTRVFERSI